ncbi:MAG: tetratricopeptide repeat protein [Planctomycetota bacterium]|nr:tetratricopeptide repeat protein [Planctomycetota bacterium]
MLHFLVLAPLLAVQAAPTSAAELWTRGQRVEAISAARSELGAEPSAESWSRLIAWQLAVHRYQAALEDTERCGPPCTAQRAEALYHLGEYARAVEILDERDPLAVAWKIDALEALSRFEESDAVLARAKAGASPGSDDPRLLGAEGRSLARRGEFGAAARAFRAALVADPFDGEALFGLGRALVQGGEREEGLRVLERHRALAPRLDAVDFARRGVDLAPAHAPNWTVLADAERALTRLDRAESAYRRAAELGKGEELVANALRWARLCSEDKGDIQAAVDLLVRTSRRGPDPRLLVRAGDLLVGARRGREAIALFEEAQALRPQDTEIAKRLATARAGDGR